MQQKNLNPQQQKAVHHEGGPLLIIAGAGTGKTTVVAERMQYLMLQKNIPASHILALTFTEKAAREMEERVDTAMPYGYSQLWISTFHSFCDRILRDEAIHIGLSPAYRLLSGADAVTLLQKVLFSWELTYFKPLGNPYKFISAMLTHFNRLQDEDITPTQYKEWVNFQTNPMEMEKLHELAYAYEKYTILKINEGVMDFADLISHVLDLFRRRPNIRATYQAQFEHLLVDEFQDTNIAQYELIKLLHPAHTKPNLIVVGDDSQSIYKFRGAAISNILSFMKDYRYATHIVLDKNYRSFQTILDVSYRLIQHNNPDTLESQLGITKQLISQREASAEESVFCYHMTRAEDEAEKAIDEIKKLKNYEWRDIAILVRANNHADQFIRALKRAGIPYQFLGPGMLFQQEEVKDLVAYLMVLDAFEDSVSLYRVLSMKTLNVPQRDVVALLQFAKRYHMSLFEACEHVSGTIEASALAGAVQLPFMSSQGQERLSEIIAMIHRHIAIRAHTSAGQLLFSFMEDAGLLAELANQDTADTEKRARNISSFFDKIKNYESTHEDNNVSAVVSWIKLSMELGESPLASEIDWFDNNAVNILTVHASKGLEFPVVFVTNLIAGRFPTYDRREKLPIPDGLIKEYLPKGDPHIQEERRLCYVAMTRAKDRLYVTASKYYGEGKRERKLSPFVTEAFGDSTGANVIQRLPAIQQLSFLDYQESKDSPKQNIIERPHVTYISHSQIETFMFCPMHYKAKYILKIPTAPHAAQGFGKSMHDALRYFYKDSMAGKKPQKHELVRLLDRVWIPFGYENALHEKQMKEMGKMQLSAYFDDQFPNEDIPIIVEKPFVFPLTPKLKAGGVIDRVDQLKNGRFRVVDYKTSDKIPTQKSVDTNRQLTMYAIALTRAPHILGEHVKDKIVRADEIDLSLYFLKESTSITTSRTQKQLDTATEEIIAVVKQIEESDFLCSHNIWCKHCEFQMLCGGEAA